MTLLSVLIASLFSNPEEIQTSLFCFVLSRPNIEIDSKRVYHQESFFEKKKKNQASFKREPNFYSAPVPLPLPEMWEIREILNVSSFHKLPPPPLGVDRGEGRRSQQVPVSQPPSREQCLSSETLEQALGLKSKALPTASCEKQF